MAIAHLVPIGDSESVLFVQMTYPYWELVVIADDVVHSSFYLELNDMF